MSWLSKLLKAKIPIINQSVAGVLGSATGNPLLKVGAEAARGGNTVQNLTQDTVAGAKTTPFAIAGAHALDSSGNSPTTAPGGAPGGGPSGTPDPTQGGENPVIQGLMDAAKGGAGAVAAFLKDHGSDLLQAAGIADAAYRETQANKYGTDALKQAQAGYDAKAPLRALGIAGMSNAGVGNPFATRMVNGQPQAPGSPSALPIAGGWQGPIAGTIAKAAGGAPPVPGWKPALAGVLGQAAGAAPNLGGAPQQPLRIAGM